MVGFFCSSCVFEIYPCCCLYANNSVFLLLSSVFKCVDKPKLFIYIAIRWWTFGLLSRIWLLWVKMLWKFVYKSYHGHLCSFLMGKYLEIELLGAIIHVHLTLWETSKLSCKETEPFYTPPQQFARVPVVLYCYNTWNHLLNLSLSSVHVVLSHCFSLHFPDD